MSIHNSSEYLLILTHDMVLFNKFLHTVQYYFLGICKRKINNCYDDEKRIKKGKTNKELPPKGG
jgi:hypothetical protein